MSPHPRVCDHAGMSDAIDDTTDDTSHNTTDVSHDTTVDVTTAAELLGISEEAVRARIRRGKLVAEKVGALWRVHIPNGDPVVTPNTTVPLLSLIHI